MFPRTPKITTQGRTPNIGTQIPNTEHRTQKTKHRTQNTDYRITKTQHRKPNTTRRTPATGPRTLNTEQMAQAWVNPSMEFVWLHVFFHMYTSSIWVSCFFLQVCYVLCVCASRSGRDVHVYDWCTDFRIVRHLLWLACVFWVYMFVVLFFISFEPGWTQVMVLSPGESKLWVFIRVAYSFLWTSTASM